MSFTLPGSLNGLMQKSRNSSGSGSNEKSSEDEEVSFAEEQPQARKRRLASTSLQSSEIRDMLENEDPVKANNPEKKYFKARHSSGSVKSGGIDLTTEESQRKRQSSGGIKMPSAYKSGNRIAPLLAGIKGTSGKASNPFGKSPSPTGLGSFKTATNPYGKVYQSPPYGKRSQTSPLPAYRGRDLVTRTYSGKQPAKVTRGTKVEERNSWIDNTNDHPLALVKSPPTPTQPRRKLANEFLAACADRGPPQLPQLKQPEIVPPERVGFPNRGLTCYMNSVLQSLLGGCPGFVQALLAQKDARGMTGAVCQLAMLKQRGITADIGWVLDDVKTELVKKNNEFAGISMQDAHEFLVTLLDTLKEESKQKPDKRVARENSSTSDKENSQVVVASGSTDSAAAAEPSNDKENCDETDDGSTADITKPSFVDDNFAFEMVETRVCMTCNKKSVSRIQDYIVKLLPPKPPKGDEGAFATNLETLLSHTMTQSSMRPCATCSERRKGLIITTAGDSKGHSCEQEFPHAVTERFTRLPRYLILYCPRIDVRRDESEEEPDGKTDPQAEGSEKPKNRDYIKVKYHKNRNPALVNQDICLEGFTVQGDVNGSDNKVIECDTTEEAASQPPTEAMSTSSDVFEDPLEVSTTSQAYVSPKVEVSTQNATATYRKVSGEVTEDKPVVGLKGGSTDDYSTGCSVMRHSDSSDGLEAPRTPGNSSDEIRRLVTSSGGSSDEGAELSAWMCRTCAMDFLSAGQLEEHESNFHVRPQRPDSRDMLAPSPSELGYLTLGDGGGDGPSTAGGAARTVRSDSDDRLQAFLSDLAPTVPETTTKPVDVITDTEVERNWGAETFMYDNEVFKDSDVFKEAVVEFEQKKKNNENTVPKGDPDLSMMSFDEQLEMALKASEVSATAASAAASAAVDEDEDLRRALEASLSDAYNTSADRHNSCEVDDAVDLNGNQMDEPAVNLTQKTKRMSSSGDSGVPSPPKRRAYDDDTNDENVGKRGDQQRPPLGADCYALAAIVSHLGVSVESGHYVADVFSQRQNSWYHYSDEHVTQRKVTKVIGESINDGYIYIYSKDGPSNN